MRVQRVVMPVTEVESWTVLDDEGVPLAPAEGYLAYLSALERSPNTVRAYGQRASTESLQQRLETIRDEISRLREENQRLRDQLARKLGHDRAASTLRAHVGDMSTPPDPFSHRHS